MKVLLLISLMLVVYVSAKLGTRCLQDSDCEKPDTECCVVSSYIIKRGKCAPRLKLGTRCKVGHNPMSSFWNLPYSCGCHAGLSCQEQNFTLPESPGVILKRDRCLPGIVKPTNIHTHAGNSTA